MRLTTISIDGTPITLEQQKAHLKVDDSADDALILVYIEGAAEFISRWTGRAIGLVTYEERFDSWEEAAVLSRFPVVEESEYTDGPIVQYLDSNNDLQTLDSDQYQVVTGARPALLKFASSLPSLGDNPNPIRVRYQAGESPAAAMIRVAVMTLVAHWYEARESVLVGTISKPVEFQLTAILEMAGVVTFGLCNQ